MAYHAPHVRVWFSIVSIIRIEIFQEMSQSKVKTLLNTLGAGEKTLAKPTAKKVASPSPPAPPAGKKGEAKRQSSSSSSAAAADKKSNGKKTSKSSSSSSSSSSSAAPKVKKRTPRHIFYILIQTTLAGFDDSPVTHKKTMAANKDKAEDKAFAWIMKHYYDDQFKSLDEAIEFLNTGDTETSEEEARQNAARKAVTTIETMTREEYMKKVPVFEEI